MQLLRVDHLGVAVASLDQAVAVWAKLGLHPKGVEEVAAQRVRVAFLPVGGTKVELLEATSPDSAIAKHIAKRGEGLHHIAYEVPDIVAAMREAKDQGMAPLTAEPSRGAGGKWVCFLHPRDTGGVLTEFVQPL